MTGCLKATILIGLVISFVLILMGCSKEPINIIPNPQQTITYETCDTPNCGDNVRIKVE